MTTMYGRARDSQRSKVYAAERRIQTGRTYGSVADMQARVDRLTDSAWFARRWPRLHRTGILVLDGRGRRRACATEAYHPSRGDYVPAIKMPLWSRQPAVLMHEIAHHCADETYGIRDVAAHGWQFAETMLVLTRHVMGDEVHATLKASYKEHKVRFKKPRKRTPLTPEQRVAAAERLAKAREAKMAKVH